MFINGVVYRLLLVKIIWYKIFDNCGCIKGFKIMEIGFINFSVVNGNLWVFCKIEYINIIKFNIFFMFIMNKVSIVVIMFFDLIR